MTDRLWNYLEKEFNTTNKDYIEIETDQDTFIVEPIYNCDNSEIIDFAVYHGSYATTVREEPNIWFWEEIEKDLVKKGEIQCII